MTWKRALARSLKIAVPCLGVVGLALSIFEWPDRLRSFLGVVGMVDSEVARWVVTVVCLAAIAYSVVYWRVGVWIERRRHKRFKNLDYLTACATVNAYTQFSPKISSAFIEHRIISKFEELCPEGVTGKATYDGYLLNSWLRFNAAELLIRNQSEFKGVPNPARSQIETNAWPGSRPHRGKAMKRWRA